MRAEGNIHGYTGGVGGGGAGGVVTMGRGLLTGVCFTLSGWAWGQGKRFFEFSADQEVGLSEACLYGSAFCSQSPFRRW